MKRRIHYGGSLSDQLNRFAEVWKRLKLGETIEPEWHLTFVAERRPRRHCEAASRIRKRMQAAGASGAATRSTARIGIGDR